MRAAVARDRRAAWLNVHHGARQPGQAVLFHGGGRLERGDDLGVRGDGLFRAVAHAQAPLAERELAVLLSDQGYEVQENSINKVPTVP